MRALLALLLLTGCASSKKQAPVIPASSEAGELHLVWESEVDDATAGLTAIRPAITGSRSALRLYDAQLQGLISLAGQPSHASVKAKAELIELADPAALAKLEEAKRLLDAKTDALEAKLRKAELEAKQARALAEDASRQARIAQASRDLSRVAVGAIALGVLAFLFGHLIGIPKWSASATVGLGVLVATLAPQLLDFFGSDQARYLMLGTFGFLALALVISLAFWTWRKLNPEKDDLPPPGDQAVS